MLCFTASISFVFHILWQRFLLPTCFISLGKIIKWLFLLFKAEIVVLFSQLVLLPTSIIISVKQRQGHSFEDTISYYQTRRYIYIYICSLFLCLVLFWRFISLSSMECNPYFSIVSKWMNFLFSPLQATEEKGENGSAKGSILGVCWGDDWWK